MWRVSTVVRQWVGASPRGTSAALGRGTDVHAFGEGYAVGAVQPRRQDIVGYTDGIRLWFKEFRPVVLFTERRVINYRKRLTGRIDLGILLDGQPTIVDYKSGGEAPANGIQLAGYVDLADADPDLHALLMRYGARTWRRAILNLPGNSEYRWRGEARLDQNDPGYFRSALARVTWRYRHGYGTDTDPERPDDDRDLALSAAGADAAVAGAGADYPIG